MKKHLHNSYWIQLAGMEKNLIPSLQVCRGQFVGCLTGEVLSSWLLPDSPRVGRLLQILSGEFRWAVLKTTAWENKETKTTIKMLPKKTNPCKMNYSENCREGEKVGGSTVACHRPNLAPWAARALWRGPSCTLLLAFKWEEPCPFVYTWGSGFSRRFTSLFSLCLEGMRRRNRTATWLPVLKKKKKSQFLLVYLCAMDLLNDYIYTLKFSTNLTRATSRWAPIFGRPTPPFH